MSLISIALPFLNIYGHVLHQTKAECQAYFNNIIVFERQRYGNDKLNLKHFFKTFLDFFLYTDFSVIPTDKSATLTVIHLKRSAPTFYIKRSVSVIFLTCTSSCFQASRKIQSLSSSDEYRTMV